MNRIALALALALPTSARAGWYSSGSWSTTPDEGLYEVFAHGVNDYPGTSSDLVNCNAAIANWVGEMSAAGYSNYKYGTDGNAWSSSWEEARYDDSYADASDFAYLCGHGNSGYVWFNGTSGDQYLYASESNWGDGDAEAIAFDSCKTLDATGRSSFGTANKNDGVHYLFGFHSNALDYATTADWYGVYLRSGYTLSSAWRTATQTTHSSSYTGAYVRFYSSSCNTASDTAYATSCDPKSSSSYATSTWAL